MGEPLVLTCDIGTQSTRSLLIDRGGTIIDVCQQKYETPYFSKNPGWAEQKPNFYFDALCATSKELCARNAEKLGDVIAVTITVIRDTVLCLDGENRPLRDIVLWLDKRRADFNDPFPQYKKLLFHFLGMTKATEIVYRASAGNWIMQQEPEIYAKTEKFVMLPTYLNYLLTGVLADSAANMIGHMPFDYKNRTWMTKKKLTRCFCDIPAEKLCRLVESGTVIGTITPEASEKSGIPAGLPLVATGSDKGCETLGLSVASSDKAAISFGTTATIQFSSQKYFEPQQFMPAYPAVLNDQYNPEIEIYRGFWLLSWFIREFGAADAAEAQRLGVSAEQVLDEKISELPPGSDGLLLQPYWTAGIIDPDALGCVIGFTERHTRYHLYRAIIEGIAMELFSSMKLMEKRSGLSIRRLYVGGGGAKSDVVCRITADVFGLPVVRIQTHEACSVGASMVAFVAKGVYADYDTAIKNMVHETAVFEPNTANHAVYQNIYEKAYSKIYQRLSPIYRELKRSSSNE